MSEVRGRDLRDRPRALLFGLAPHGDPRAASEILHELGLLADTGNFDVVGHLVQHRRSGDPHTYLGSGKLSELADAVRETNAEVAICNEQLGPLQGRNVEQAAGAPILDRSELILLIFETHAATVQSKLQVELAQLRYQLPRLKRMWAHLERQRGGIGVRGGAGEKQIDLDRGYLKTRINGIERQLTSIAAHKSRQIAARGDLYTIALVGYTNAGKSTLMNRLTDAGVVAEDRLFSTLDTRTRPWRLAGGRTVLLSDTVGFIRNLPHELVASFHATLEEALTADLLFVVIDASDPESVEQLDVVDEVLDQLGASAIPRLCILNKVDAVTDHSTIAALRTREPEAIAVSARTGAGIADVEQSLLDHLLRSGRRICVRIPHSAGALQAELRRTTTVLSEEHDEEGVTVDCIASHGLAGRLAAKGMIFREP
jgi:GTP-binding protein HflX